MIGHLLTKANLSRINEFQENPKKHQLDMIVKSIVEFGFTVPVLVNSENDTLLAGHGRIEALRQMLASGGEIPKGVEAIAGDWVIPVVEVAVPVELHEAYVVMDNRATEVGGWDGKKLISILERQAKLGLLETAGYDDSEFRKLLKSLDKQPVPERSWEDGGELHELLDKWQVKEGDVFSVGRHRVICGDGTDPEVISELRGDLVEGLLLTDPPYANGLSTGGRSTKTTDIKGNADDEAEFRRFIRNALLNTFADVAYIFTAWELWPTLIDEGVAAGFNTRTMGVWAKTAPTLGAGWRRQHELFYVGYRSSKKIKATMSLGNLFTISTTPHKFHPTSKPVALLTQMLPADTSQTPVLDMFLGSGSTLLACEEYGRVCLGVELDPMYLAGSLERFSQIGLEVSKNE